MSSDITLKMDLKQEDLLMFFKPWQLKCLKYLWSTGDERISREIWEPISSEISRASVINFLEEATRNGLLIRTETTGKGGHRGLYKARYNESGTKSYLKEIFSARLLGL